MICRSWLFVPGDSEKMLAKSGSLGADALVFDLEDAVIDARKQAARQRVGEHLESAPRSGSELWVRVNALDTGLAADDLRAVMPARPDGIVLPKAGHAQDGEALADMIAGLEDEFGIERERTRIMLIAIETAKALLAVNSYTQVHPRVVGLSWGAVDLSASIGALSNSDGEGRFTAPYVHARTMTLVAAGAAGVPAIDTAFLDFRDEAGLRANCQEARRDGFVGKMAIHPAQVGVINDAFMPSAAEVERAQVVVEIFARNPDAGTVNLDGRMLDKPHLVQARRILDIAKRK